MVFIVLVISNAKNRMLFGVLVKGYIKLALS